MNIELNVKSKKKKNIYIYQDIGFNLKPYVSGVSYGDNINKPINHTHTVWG